MTMSIVSVFQSRCSIRGLFSIGFFILLLLLSSSAISQESPSIDSKWGLWIDGPHLRGANIIQRRVYPDVDGPTYMGPGPMGPPFTQEDFDELAALGANYVNISYSGLFRIDPPYAVDLEVQENLDQLLSMIAQADMFAVISFRSGPGRSEFAMYYWEGLDAKYFNDTVWSDRAAQDAWVAMWRHTAERYRDNSIVAGYDLMVEPNSNDSGSDALNAPLEIWEPDEFYSQYRDTLYDWNQLYPRIVNAIREVDSETPILIAGNGYSGVRWLPYLTPVDDPHTVYVVHQYEPQEQYTHKDYNDSDFLQATYPGVIDTDWDGVEEPFNRTWLENLLSTIEAFQQTHQVQVAVNEYGILRWVKNAVIYMRDEMDLFERRGINYALWEWRPAWEPMAGEDDGFDFMHGPDPGHHTDVSTSDLIDAIEDYWRRNTIRPSTMAVPGLPTPTPVGVKDWALY